MEFWSKILQQNNVDVNFLSYLGQEIDVIPDEIKYVDNWWVQNNVNEVT